MAAANKRISKLCWKMSSAMAISTPCSQGQIESGLRSCSDATGGILFTEAEVRESNEINTEFGRPLWKISKLATA